MADSSNLLTRGAQCLYLSYDGLTDQLGESQVLPYVVGLSKGSYRFHVVSFEKPAAYRSAGQRTRRFLEGHGVEWTAISYTKRPPVLSTVYDTLRMYAAARRIVDRTPTALLHARSYVPALVAHRLNRTRGIPWVFDMRGFWPDEKVDSGAWRLEHPLYRQVYAFFKEREQRFLAGATAIVSLTEAGATELRREGRLAPDKPLAVIPCSVDFEAFRPAAEREREELRARVGIAPREHVLVYAGSLGTWYMLGEMLDYFSVLRKQTADRAHFLVLTRDSPETVLSLAAARNLPSRCITVRSASRAEMPEWLATADSGISFIRPSPSKVSSSPTKVGEYLAAGLPVVANTGIGDLDNILHSIAGGSVIGSFSDAEYAEAARKVLSCSESSRHSLRDRARTFYDLDHALRAYERVYALVSRSRSTRVPLQRVAS